MSIGKNTKKIKILEKQIFRGSPASKMWQKPLKNRFFMNFRNIFKPLPFQGHNHPQMSFKVAEFVSSRTKKHFLSNYYVDSGSKNSQK